MRGELDSSRSRRAMALWARLERAPHCEAPPGPYQYDEDLNLVIKWVETTSDGEALRVRAGDVLVQYSDRLHSTNGACYLTGKDGKSVEIRVIQDSYFTLPGGQTVTASQLFARAIATCNARRAP